MKSAKSETEMQWAIEWLDAVASGTNTMSRRKLSTIEKHGDLSAIKKLAEERSIHLLQLEDEKGDQLIAASVKPFKVIC